jgi:hypothetical protein
MLGSPASIAGGREKEEKSVEKSRKTRYNRVGQLKWI